LVKPPSKSYAIDGRTELSDATCAGDFRHFAVGANDFLREELRLDTPRREPPALGRGGACGARDARRGQALPFPALSFLRVVVSKRPSFLGSAAALES
jgi:hypothetical protein